jgi:DNA repair exonuclease SbcCD nuclease subunit
MAIASRQLYRLAAEHQIPTIIIAGNHDAPKQPHVGAALDVFRQIDNLYVAAADRLELFEIAGGRFFALPHVLTTPKLRDQLELCRPDPSAVCNVLIAHGVAAGMPEFSMADLGEMELPLEFLDRFDYAALGHFHNFCQVSERAWYAGSTERLSQSEREAAKGFAVVETDPLEVRFEEVKTRTMIDLPKVDASGKRGDQVVEIIRQQLDAVGSSDKIVRVNVENVSPETLKTLPAEVLVELREKAYSLDIRFDKAAADEEPTEFGRSAIGRLDQSFLNYLETVDLKGFDKDRLIGEAMKYLKAEE